MTGVEVIDSNLFVIREDRFIDCLPAVYTAKTLQVTMENLGLFIAMEWEFEAQVYHVVEFRICCSNLVVGTTFSFPPTECETALISTRPTVEQTMGIPFKLFGAEQSNYSVVNMVFKAG